MSDSKNPDREWMGGWVDGRLYLDQLEAADFQDIIILSVSELTDVSGTAAQELSLQSSASSRDLRLPAEENGAAERQRMNG